jgi:hypothetical protein
VLALLASARVNTRPWAVATTEQQTAAIVYVFTGTSVA